jgi:TatA/E family protein of Tat protein translocase
MGLGPTEIMIICGAVFILFGAKQLPKWARAMGEAKKELGKLVDDDEKDD